MGLAIKASFKPSPSLRRTLAAMQAPGLTRVQRRALLKCAFLALENITSEQIIRGGRVRGPRGPKGGKGKLVSAPAHPSKLTSRHGDLRRSLGKKFGIDRSGLPRYLDIGTDLVYGAAHEFGAKIKVSPKMRAALHYKGIHLRAKTKRIILPPRPFIKPGLEAVEPKFPNVFVREWKEELGL